MSTIYLNKYNGHFLKNEYTPFVPVTDIVPLAAFNSGTNYLYCKNFTLTGGYTTITATFQNISVSDSRKLSFQNGGVTTGGRLIGGIYGYGGASTSCLVDFSPGGDANKFRGAVMFGPSSYYTGAEENRPNMVAMVANTQNNAASAADIQVGGHCTNNNHFEFDTPLSSNLYGVYGFVSNVDYTAGSPTKYGGNMIAASAFTESGFDFYCYAANRTNTIYDSANYQMVVIQ